MSKEDYPVIAVTGGNRGVGFAVAERFHSLGWNVETCSRGESKSEISNHSCFDISDSMASRDWIQNIYKKYSRIDVLVNNAGIIQRHPDEDWDEEIAVNLSAVYRLSHQAAQFLPCDGSGRIINISSVLGQIGVADQPAYCASKHGVIGLTKSMALRLADNKITVNAICPGWIETDMMASRLQQLQTDAQGALSGIPLKKPLKPGDIANTVEYLVSPGASLITGQTITIDGGYLAGPL